MRLTSSAATPAVPAAVVICTRAIHRRAQATSRRSSAELKPLGKKTAGYFEPESAGPSDFTRSVITVAPSALMSGLMYVVYVLYAPRDPS